MGQPITMIGSVYFPKLWRIPTKGAHALLYVRPEEPRTETNPGPQLTSLLRRLVHLLSGPRPCVPHVPGPDRALRLDEAASLLAMSYDFVYRNWKRLGGYKDTDHRIKFRMSDIQRHLQRKAKECRP
jgi:hypothetical protein